MLLGNLFVLHRGALPGASFVLKGWALVLGRVWAPAPRVKGFRRVGLPLSPNDLLERCAPRHHRVSFLPFFPAYSSPGPGSYVSFSITNRGFQRPLLGVLRACIRYCRFLAGGRGCPKIMFLFPHFGFLSFLVLNPFLVLYISVFVSPSAVLPPRSGPVSPRGFLF